MAKRSNTEVIKSRAVFESKIDTIAQLQVDVASMIAARDKEKEALLLKWNTKIKDLEKEIKREQTALQSYAQLHWKELGGPKAKTAHTPLANYGFRTGQPTVKLIKRRKEAEVAQELYDEGYDNLVETTHKLDKKAIMKAYNAGNERVIELFKTDQIERFFVEAKAQQED